MTLPFYDVNVVIFDCDSTLSAVEGIDELAARKGVDKQLAPLTTAAMEGRMKLEDIYGHRLALIRPARKDIDWLIQHYIDSVVSDAGYVINTLQDAGKEIHIVSGGIRQAVTGLARHLGIDDSHVHAVDLSFDPEGGYLGYDENSPLSCSGGKRTVCRAIIHPRNRAVMVGDGITDLEAEQQGVDFIGFGGIINRPHIREKARDYIDGPDLHPLLRRLLEKPPAA